MRRVVLLIAALLLWSSPALAQGTVMPLPVVQFADTNGVPLSGGLLYTCTQGGSCPGSTQTTYSDAALTTPNTNPVVLDTAGRAHVFVSSTTYKFLLQTSAGVTVWTQDNVTTLAGVSLATLTGATVTFKAPTVLTVSANAVTPTQNIHGLDTSGGAQNLNTINTSSVSAGFVLYLYGNNPGSNPVTITSAGNIVLAGGSYALNTTGAWATLILRGTTWYELGRSGSGCGTVVGKTASYAAAICDIVEFTSGAGITLTLPAASGCVGTANTIGVKNDTATVITVARTGTDTIDGATSFSTYGVQYESFDFVCNAAGTGWMIR